MKIDKYIGQTGYTSRRKACDLIENKRVQVNGKTATFSTTVNEGDVVSVDGVRLKTITQKPVFIAYHKPKGVICTTEKIEGNIIDAVNHPARIYPVGRLDKDSEGLILLTNQGELIDRITNPKFEHEKEYIVTLNLPVRTRFLEDIARGIDIQGELTRPSIATRVLGTKRVFKIILTQGMNRQIRRICNVNDYQVIKLQRVRVMNIELGKLKSGEWRDLTEEELSQLLAQVEKEEKDMLLRPEVKLSKHKNQQGANKPLIGNETAFNSKRGSQIKYKGHRAEKPEDMAEDENSAGGYNRMKGGHNRTQVKKRKKKNPDQKYQTSRFNKPAPDSEIKSGNRKNKEKPVKIKTRRKTKPRANAGIRPGVSTSKWENLGD